MTNTHAPWCVGIFCYGNEPCAQSCLHELRIRRMLINRVGDSLLDLRDNFLKKVCLGAESHISL